MRTVFACILFVFLLGQSAMAEPWLDGRLMGLAVGDSEAAAREKFGDQCDAAERRVITPPSHPSAESSEVHLVCSWR